MKSIIFTLFFMSLSGLASASDTATGKVTLIGGQYINTSAVYFGLDVAPANRPACSTHPDYFYVLDINTEEGKALYSAILMAKASDLTMTVKGVGSCGRDQPMELVSYWILRP